MNEHDSLRINEQTPTRHLEGEWLHLSQLLTAPLEHQRAFEIIVGKLEKCPRYEGLAINKAGVKTAEFGQERTTVDIRLNNASISLIFHCLDTEKLEQLCKDERVDVFTLQECFLKKASGSSEKLVIEINLEDNGRHGLVTRAVGRIEKYDIVERKMKDAIPQLPANIQNSRLLHDALKNGTVLVPFLLSQIEKKHYQPNSYDDHTASTIRRYKQF